MRGRDGKEKTEPYFLLAHGRDLTSSWEEEHATPSSQLGVTRYVADVVVGSLSAAKGLRASASSPRPHALR
jgi:hypothetical protein